MPAVRAQCDLCWAVFTSSMRVARRNGLQWMKVAAISVVGQHGNVRRQLVYDEGASAFAAEDEMARPRSSTEGEGDWLMRCQVSRCVVVTINKQFVPT
jgi:hypothetical protein